MEKIVIKISDKNKAELLTEILKSLDFIYKVDSGSKMKGLNKVKKSKKAKTKSARSDKDNFYRYAGIWEKRDISLNTIRDRAWKRKI